MNLVQAIDKKFYLEPTWYGSVNERQWVISFQEDDELVLTVSGKKNGRLLKSLVKGWMFDASLIRMTQSCFFPVDNITGDGTEYLIQSKSLYPIPMLNKGVTQDPDFDNLRHAWCLTFPTLSVKAYFAKGPVALCRYLAGFMLGREVFDPKPVQELVASELAKCFKDIRKLSVEECHYRYGLTVSVYRQYRKDENVLSQNPVLENGSQTV